MAQAVLFACTMNAVRSPMAAAMLRHLTRSSVYIESAGVRAGELDPLAVEFESLAVQPGRNADRPAQDTTGMRPGTGNGEVVPRPQTPRPIVAQPHRDNRNPQSAGEKHASRRQPAPRPTGTVRGDRQISGPRPAGQFAQRRTSAMKRTSADNTESHHLCQPGKHVGIPVAREEHRDVAVATEEQREQDPLVPEDVDFCPPVFRMDRIDGRIPVINPVVERSHPLPDGSAGGERSGTDGQGRCEFHGANPFLFVPSAATSDAFDSPQLTLHTPLSRAVPDLRRPRPAQARGLSTVFQPPYQFPSNTSSAGPVMKT